MMASAILSDTIPCDQLLIQEELDATLQEEVDAQTLREMPESEQLPMVSRH
jgi:hypothetical protein